MERSQQEEFANTLTHGIGLLLVLAGTFVLLGALTEKAGSEIWIACSVYLATLLSVYISSTLSHYFTEPVRQSFFRKLDQACIYLLIVGTYTPYSVAHLHDAWWFWLLGIMWAVAIIGVVSKLLFAHRVERVSIWLYLLLGWMPALGGVHYAPGMPRECFLWIVAGGVVYSAGTVFLINDRKATYFHAIWHLFVILGSMIHFLGIMKCVVR